MEKPAAADATEGRCSGQRRWSSRPTSIFTSHPAANVVTREQQPRTGLWFPPCMPPVNKTNVKTGHGMPVSSSLSKKTRDDLHSALEMKRVVLEFQGQKLNSLIKHEMDHFIQ